MHQNRCARVCTCAFQCFDQHAWCSKTHASSEDFLPSAIGLGFDANVLACSHNFVFESAMQAFAMGRQFAL
jgi:hypothetical protein